MRALILLVLAGCGTAAPEVRAVAPVEVEPGQTVNVSGQHLGDGARVTLVGPGSTEVVLEGVAETESGLTALVPGSLSPGRYDLVVSRNGLDGRLLQAVEVVGSPDDAPCQRDYRANTEVSIPKEELVVRRFYRDGTEESVRTSVQEVARIEYELVKTQKGMCSVIYVRRTDESRYVFADALDTDLRFRAEKVARTIERPFEATRVDTGGFADAVED